MTISYLKSLARARTLRGDLKWHDVHSNRQAVMNRAYFKGSLQLQRTEKFPTCKHFKVSCKKNLSFPKNFRQLFF